MVVEASTGRVCRALVAVSLTRTARCPDCVATGSVQT